MSWKDIIKEDKENLMDNPIVRAGYNKARDKDITIFRIAERFYGVPTRVKIEDLLAEIRSAMNHNEGKEYQELKEMESQLERLR
tara:strand:- start:684 stop:935 length:252 start_codon:yes stop_codon:yes gene_type:complete